MVAIWIQRLFSGFVTTGRYGKWLMDINLLRILITRYALTQCLVLSTSIVVQCLPIRIIHVSKLSESTLPSFKLSTHYYLTFTVSFWQISPHSMTASWMVSSKKCYRNHRNGIQWWMKRGRGQLVIFAPLGLLPFLSHVKCSSQSHLTEGNSKLTQPLCVCLLVRSRTVNGRWRRALTSPEVRVLRFLRWDETEKNTSQVTRSVTGPWRWRAVPFISEGSALEHMVRQRMPYSLQECRPGAQLPLISRWARRWINHWSLWCMAGYLPSHRASPPFDRYQFILLGDSGTWV